MNSVYHIDAFYNVFDAACVQFDSMLTELAGKGCADMDHCEAEAMIARMGLELNRRLLQGYLFLRSAGELRREDVVGPEGQILPHCRRNCEKN